MRGESGAARVAAICAALTLALAGLYPGNNPDTFGHLAQGRQIAKLGAVPQVDTWSLLPGPPRPWHNYEWLSDLGSYLLYRELGYPALTFFKCLLLVITALALARFAEQIGGARASLLTSLVVVSAIPAIRIRLSDRPHVLGICLVAVYLLALSRLSAWLETGRDDRRVRRRCLLLLGILGGLHVIWVNAHGSHLLGLAVTASFTVFAPRSARLHLLGLAGLELAASCVSPYGPAIVLDALDHVADPRYRQLITEWLPWRETDPAWFQLGPALQGAVLTLLAPRLVRRSTWELPVHSPSIGGVPLRSERLVRARSLNAESAAPLLGSARAGLAVAALLGIASFRSIRFIAEFMLLSAPLVGIGLASLAAAMPARRLAGWAAIAALALAPGVPLATRALPPDLPIGVGMSFAGLPRASGLVLARYGSAPRVLASMQDSWYTMFAAERARLVVDGRVPFYGPDHIARVSEAFGERTAFDRAVETYGVNAVIAGHATVEDHLLSDFGRAHGFALVLIEDQHALYVREGALGPSGVAALPALRALRASYALDWILAAPASASETVRAELTRLAAYPGTEGFRAWVEGVLALAPLRRGTGSDGFRWPRDEADWAIYRAARPKIARAAEAAAHVPVVAALEAELAAMFCEFDAAERALARALAEKPSREPLLVGQELALRRGKVDEVRRIVAQARNLPQGQHDPWLAELARGVESPPACP